MLDKILHSLYNNMRGSETGLRKIEVWLSLVERCVRDAEAVGSSPVTSTNKACISFWIGCTGFLFGGIAQLVRAFASHARGRGFESLCLYQTDFYSFR